MVKVSSDSLRAGGVEVIHEKPEGKLAGRIFGALFDKNQLQSGLRPATAPKHPESRRAPAWGEGDASQGTNDAGNDDTTNPFGIDFTEEDFQRLERKWGVHGLLEEAAGSDAGPSGSGRIGGSVYTPDPDASKVSDKRAIAVGFGCTYVAGSASVVMINDAGERPSVDEEGGAAWARVGGGGSGGGGDIESELETPRKSGVQTGGRGRPCKSLLSTYTPSEGTSDERTYSCTTAIEPEGTPKVMSMAFTRRQHSPQDTNVPALFSAVDSSFNELFPSSARLHDVGSGPQSDGCDAGTVPPAKHAGAVGLSRGAGPASSGGGVAFVETPTNLQEISSSKYTPPPSPPIDIESTSSSESAALCETPIEQEEVDLVERADLGSPSRAARPAMSGGCAELDESPIKPKELNLAERVDPGSHLRDVGPVMSGERASSRGSPSTVKEDKPCEVSVPVIPSRVTHPARNGGGAAVYKASITCGEGDSAECMVLVSPSRDAGAGKRYERTPSRRRKTVDEEMNLENCAGLLFSGAFGLHIESGGQADGVLASAARAPKAAAPAAPVTNDDSLRPDKGTCCGGSVATATPGTKAAPAPGGYTLRSTTAFLQRTAGAIAASFFGASLGSARMKTTGFDDDSAAKSEEMGWREFPGSVPRETSVWYHASILAPVSMQVV